LRLNEAEFWALTPGEFGALLARKLKEEEWLNWRPALITAALANIFRGRDQKEYQPQDFMPKFKEEEKEMSDEQLFNTVRLINRAMGGREVVA